MTDSFPEPPPGRLALESEADPHDADAWERAAAAVLRKARRLTDEDPDAAAWGKLTQQSLAGVAVLPLYSAAHVDGLPDPGVPGAPPYTRGRVSRTPEQGWDIRIGAGGADPRVVAETLRTELENGATSVWLRVGPGVTTADLAARLDGVAVGRVPVVLDAPEDPLGAASAFASWLASAGVAASEGTNLGVDPLGALVRRGGSADGWSGEDVVAAAVLARSVGTLGLVVDATAVHDLGASETQELSFGLAAGATYLRLLTDAGLSVEEALGALEFRYAATDDQFLTIAKLRAARRLWDRVGELSGASADARGQRQHAVTSRPMMSKYDPWVNILRSTVAAFAAGVGGADAVTVVPFDSPLGEPDALGRRIARNTSSLLLEESHVGLVDDPAGGSYAVERLTDDLAREAWDAFGRLEAGGGLLAALVDGSLLRDVDEVVARRDAQVARRQRPLTGLTEFPNLGETLPERPPAAGGGAVRRYGAAFEALRDLPTPPPVFLATMGSVAAHTARAMFATNLLAAGGVPVVVAGATRSAEDVVAAYAGQPVVCLAGSDKAYGGWGADLVAALRAAGARHVILAGTPGDATVPPDLLDDSCALGVDALAFLTRTRTHVEANR
jgi:methylmalonyl-CoA mutase